MGEDLYYFSGFSISVGDGDKIFLLYFSLKMFFVDEEKRRTFFFFFFTNLFTSLRSFYLCERGGNMASFLHFFILNTQFCRVQKKFQGKSQPAFPTRQSGQQQGGIRQLTPTDERLRRSSYCNCVGS